MVADPVSDFIVRVKNASNVGKDTILVPFTALTENVANLLKKEGYLSDVEKKGKKIKKSLEVTLNYDEAGNPRVRGVKRLSKLSRRVYTSAKDIAPVKSGHGIVVLSTPEGVLTGGEARKKGVGGELLFEMW